MKTSQSVGKLSEKEYSEFLFGFNACHKATDKKQAIVSWLRKYNVDNFGTPISFCGQVTETETPGVTFEGNKTITFFAE